MVYQRMRNFRGVLASNPIAMTIQTLLDDVSLDERQYIASAETHAASALKELLIKFKREFESGLSAVRQEIRHIDETIGRER